MCSSHVVNSVNEQYNTAVNNKALELIANKIGDIKYSLDDLHSQVIAKFYDTVD